MVIYATYCQLNKDKVKQGKTRLNNTVTHCQFNIEPPISKVLYTCYLSIELNRQWKLIVTFKSKGQAKFD